MRWVGYRENSKSEMQNETVQLVPQKYESSLGITMVNSTENIERVLGNLEEKDKFLDLYEQPKLNCEDKTKQNLSRLIISNEIGSGIKSSNKENLRTRWFQY